MYKMLLFKKLLNIVLERKNILIRPILRGESLVKELIEGRMKRNKDRGRPCIVLLDDIEAIQDEKIKRRAIARMLI